jgi:hypothetical protein
MAGRLEQKVFLKRAVIISMLMTPVALIGLACAYFFCLGYSSYLVSYDLERIYDAEMTFGGVGILLSVLTVVSSRFLAFKIYKLGRTSIWVLLFCSLFVWSLNITICSRLLFVYVNQVQLLKNLLASSLGTLLPSQLGFWFFIAIIARIFAKTKARKEAEQRMSMARDVR